MSHDLDDAPPSRTGRIVVTAIVVGIVAMWGYVLYLAVFEGRQESPDRIDEPAFTSAAEDTCRQVVDFVDTLPRAEQADSPAERADTVERATDRFQEMVADLERLATTIDDAGAASLVEQWLADWEVLLGDRRQFVDRLRERGEDARFTVTPGPSGRQITLRIDEFAATNDMPSCATPGDV